MIIKEDTQMQETLQYIDEIQAETLIQRLLKLMENDKIGYHYEKDHHLLFLGYGYDCCFSAGTQIELEDGHPVIEFGSDMEHNHDTIKIKLDEPDENILPLLKHMDMECMNADPTYHDEYCDRDQYEEICDYGPITRHNPYNGCPYELPETIGIDKEEDYYDERFRY